MPQIQQIPLGLWPLASGCCPSWLTPAHPGVAPPSCDWLFLVLISAVLQISRASTQPLDLLISRPDESLTCPMMGNSRRYMRRSSGHIRPDNANRRMKRLRRPANALKNLPMRKLWRGGYFLPDPSHILSSSYQESRGARGTRVRLPQCLSLSDQFASRHAKT